MRAVAERHGGGGAGDFLNGDGMGEVGHARAAVSLIDGDAQQAKLAHFGPKLRRENIAVVDLRRHRGDAVLRPAMDHLAQGSDIFSKVEFHCGCEHRDGLFAGSDAAQFN